jgi:hypothetical protein
MPRSLLIGLIFLFNPPVLAQDKPALRVVVEGIGSEAVNCGIRKAPIEALAERALKSHGIRISKDARDPYLYLNVNAYRVMQEQVPVGCTTRLGVSVRANPDAEPAVRAFKSKVGTYVVLCDAGRLLSGAVRDVAGAVTKAFEEDIKSCLAQLSY